MGKPDYVGPGVPVWLLARPPKRYGLGATQPTRTYGSRNERRVFACSDLEGRRRPDGRKALRY